MTAPGCPFCERVANREMDRAWVREGINVGMFKPLNPVTPGHRLFVPWQHVPNAAYNQAVTAAVFGVASEFAAGALEGFNLITSAGRDATQTVDHLHVHYVPRHYGDGLHLPWTGQGAPILDEAAIRADERRLIADELENARHQTWNGGERRPSGFRAAADKVRRSGRA